MDIVKEKPWDYYVIDWTITGDVLVCAPNGETQFLTLKEFELLKKNRSTSTD